MSVYGGKCLQQRWPVKEGDDMGTHTYECTKYNSPLYLVWLLGNLFLTLFPKAHPDKQYHAQNQN